MVFYTGKLVLELNNPTIVLINDRNDLDDQLFDTFSRCHENLRQHPVQAETRDELKKLLPTGLIISPSHEALLPQIPPQNIEALFQAVRE